MTVLQYILASTFGLALVAGQILFKIAANQKTPQGEPLAIIALLFSWPMIAACTLYGLTTILYVYLLQQIPLSRAYLFSIAGAAIVPFLAILIFKEDFSIKYVFGVILVLSGIAVSTTA